MSHTPGPWKAEKWGSVVDAKPLIYSRGKRCSQVAMATLAGEISEEERDANARLIAAAPDLLEALKTALERMQDIADYPTTGFMPQCSAAIALAEHVIAKAEGGAA